jgi:hypothetical protein
LYDILKNISSNKDELTASEIHVVLEHLLSMGWVEYSIITGTLSIDNN